MNCKYKVGDVITWNKNKRSEATIVEIISQEYHYYRFRFFNENDTHTMRSDDVDKSTNFNIIYLRREKLNKLYEI